MEDIELLECLIETEINKLMYARRIATNKGQVNRRKALTQQILGLKKSLKFINEVKELEE
ncbi:hypothetical protein [Clostridium beijerinckii]|uniref:hypothetical protein n=1 Tax=Clostridium beijerinckii TaxID=1520 RepID=UPI001F15AA12|nr:hypothetical protein [Clostridium beijerinckii]